jgi:voltage-gated potassium channel Kch
MTQTKDSALEIPSTDSVFQSIADEGVETLAVPAGMDLCTAVHLIEGRDSDARFSEAKRAIDKQLCEAHDDEERGTCYYYLLRLLLRGHMLFENKEARDLYAKMLESFRSREIEYKKDYLSVKNKEDKKIIYSQIDAFYQLIDIYLGTLETIYEKRGLTLASERVYIEKMNFRRRHALFSGKHMKHLGHLFLDKTSRYGHSLGRWVATVLFFIAIFAVTYAILDYFSAIKMLADYSYSTNNLFDYFYFSIVTFTTLGYGDIVPVTILEKAIVGVEVVLGYTMLGVLINLIKQKS